MPPPLPIHYLPAFDPNDYLRNPPENVDRKIGAAIITHRFFPVSARSLERWPVKVRFVNGRALMRTADLLALAQAKLDAAPEVMIAGKTAA